MKKINIFVAGHNGMVGSAITNILKKKKNIKILTQNKKNLDLTNQNSVRKFFKSNKVDQVYLAAAKVGGIYANNKFPAEFIHQNLLIQSNVIHNSFLSGVKKLLFLGSSCIYPKNSNQPIKENNLLQGTLEPTNEPYAIAKIAGIKMCESYNRQYSESHGVDYRCVMPTNLYGPGDNYHPENSHVIPGLINRFHEAKINNLNSVSIWGSGKPKREFLFVNDLARACVHIMNKDKKVFEKYINPRCSHINIGSGEELSIFNLANIIKEVVQYEGKIIFDIRKPDGVYRKFIDSKLSKKLGWRSKTKLKEGLKKTYKEYLKECFK